jgi:uncharacterized membrane protein
VNNRTMVLLFLCLSALSVRAPAADNRPAQSGQKDPQTTKAGGGEPIEEVQEVTPVESASPPGAWSVVGKLHPALVHFPIAWVMLVQMIDLTAVFTRRKEWTTVGLYLLILACLSFIPAAATGLIRAGAMSKDLEIQTLLSYHRNLNIAAGLICAGGLAVRLAMRNSLQAKWKWVYFLFMWSCGAALFIAGHLGGKMVFGSDYLPF